MAFGVTAEQVRTRRAITGAGLAIAKLELEKAAAQHVLVDAIDRGDIKPDLGEVLQWLLDRKTIA